MRQFEIVLLCSRTLSLAIIKIFFGCRFVLLRLKNRLKNINNEHLATMADEKKMKLHRCALALLLYSCFLALFLIDIRKCTWSYFGLRGRSRNHEDLDVDVDDVDVDHVKADPTNRVIAANIFNRSGGGPSLVKVEQGAAVDLLQLAGGGHVGRRPLLSSSKMVSRRGIEFCFWSGKCQHLKRWYSHYWKHPIRKTRSIINAR